MASNRRQFLAGVTAAAPAVLRGQSTAKLKTALVGCGWYGMVDVNAALQNGGVEIMALCDVDSDHLNQSAAEVEKAQGARPLRAPWASHRRATEVPPYRTGG